MGVLRVTSPDTVRGRISDDGFEIGQVSAATVFLLAITTGLGAVVGVVYIAVRRAVPGRWGRWGWILVGTTVGGSLLLHADGVDFNLLEPTWLAVALFILIPAGGAALMAFWVERWDRWWLTDRRRTIIAALPTVVLIPLIFPVLVAAAAVVLVAIAVAERQDSLRRPDRRPPDRAGSRWRSWQPCRRGRCSTTSPRSCERRRTSRVATRGRPRHLVAVGDPGGPRPRRGDHGGGRRARRQALPAGRSLARPARPAVRRRP